MGPNFVCEQCHQRRTGKPHITVTGRSICTPCNDVLLGAAAGAIAGSWNAGSTIATSGVFARIRAARRAKRQ